MIIISSLLIIHLLVVNTHSKLIEFEMEQRSVIPFKEEEKIIIKTAFAPEVVLTKNLKAQLYCITLNVGTPSRHYVVIVDTGSNVLWLPSSDCYQCSSNIEKFPQSQSSSYRNLSQPYKIDYADGSSSTGYLGQELVATGNIQSNLTFLLAYNVKFAVEGTSGILGLGVDYQGMMQSSYVYMLHQNKQIEKLLFSQKFEGKKGKLYIGDYAPEIANNTSNLTSCRLNNGGFHQMWACSLDRYFSGYFYSSNKTINVTNTQVLFDSGTNFIILPESYRFRILDTIMGDYLKKKYCLEQQGYYICNRVRYLHFPPLYFIINGIAYKLDGDDLFMEIEGGFSSNWIQFRVNFNNGAVDQNLIILGQPFLQKYHVVYDMEQKAISLFGGKRYNATEYIDTDPIPSDDGVPVSIFILLGVVIILIIGIVVWKFKKGSSSGVRVGGQENNNVRISMRQPLNG